MRPDALKDLRREISSLQKQLHAKDTEIQEMWEDFTTLSASHERWEKEAEEARIDADELKKLNGLLESQGDNLVDEVQNARRETIGARKESEDAQHVIRALEEELWHAREEARVAKEEARAAREEVEVEREESKRAKADAFRARQEVGHLRAVLSADTEIDKLLVILQASIEMDNRESGSESEDFEDCG